MVSEQHSLLQEIQSLISEKLFIRIESPEQDLFKTGILDSLILVQLILELEEHFGWRLPMEDLDLGSFCSVVKIAELVSTKRRQSFGAA